MKREIYKRRYKLLADFTKVQEFLTEIYSLDTLNSYLLPQFLSMPIPIRFLITSLRIASAFGKTPES